MVRKSAVAQLVFRRLGKWNGVSPLRPQGRPLLQSAANPTASATLRQIDAPDDLVTSVPIYGVVGEVVGQSKIYLGRVFAEGPETRFTLPVPVSVKKLVVDPYQTVLTAP